VARVTDQALLDQLNGQSGTPAVQALPPGTPAPVGQVTPDTGVGANMVGPPPDPKVTKFQQQTADYSWLSNVSRDPQASQANRQRIISDYDYAKRSYDRIQRMKEYSEKEAVAPAAMALNPAGLRSLLSPPTAADAIPKGMAGATSGASSMLGKVGSFARAHPWAALHAMNSPQYALWMYVLSQLRGKE